MATIKTYWKYFKGYKIGLILGPTFKLTEAVFELFIPLLMAEIINNGIPNNDVKYILQVSGIMLGLGALGLVLALICQYYAAQVAYGFGTALRNDLFAHIMSLSGKEVGDIGISTLVTRMTNDVTLVQNGVNWFIRLAVRAPYIMIGCIIMAFLINAQIAIIFTIASVLICICLYLVMSRTIPKYKDIQKTQDIIARKSSENLSGARVIRAFSRQQEQISKFGEESDNLYDMSVKVGKISGALNPLTFAIANIAIIAIVWLGSTFVDVGTLQNGDIIALVSYMTQTMIVLVVFANFIILFNKSIASAVRISAVLAINPEITEPAMETDFPFTEKSIEFKNVCFAYNQDTEPVINDVTFTVNKGQTVGIIGGTGSGKSTIVQLLTRIFEVDAGSICIDGVDVKDYKFDILKRKIGVVPQESILLKGTILSNLLFANPKSTEQEIENALQISQAKAIVNSKKDGVLAQVLEGGKNLSGGQRQRIAIARAVVKNPEILILDDSASALDYATDAQLRKSIRQDCSQMTVVMVSQRASTIKNSDIILVLNDGVIEEQGTHAELVKKSGLYYEICVSQKLIVEADENDI